MEVNKSIWMVVCTSLLVGGTAVAKHFNFFIESDSTSVTSTEEQQPQVAQDTNIQKVGDGNENSPVINGDGNSVNNSETDNSTENNDIEEQRNIESIKNNVENAGSDNTLCFDNNDSACNNNGTSNNNPIN